MFENFEAAKKRKAPKWATPLLVAGLAVHAGILMAMWIKSIWVVERLEPPKGRYTMSSFTPPTLPGRPPAGKKPEVKKTEPKKRQVKETVQPVTQDKIVNEAPSTATDDSTGDPDGPPCEGPDCDSDAPPCEGPDCDDGKDPGPPPPPPPPAPPQNVAPTALEQQRTAGEKQIQPDDVTKTEIQRSGKAKLVASYKICITTSGAIQSISQLKSSGFPAYDSKLQREMKSTWKYRPFMVNGKAAPVCTAVTFIYSQKT
jgi:hypothetical protein